MFHIKNFNLFLESISKKLLYHGSPYLFKTFSDTTTFFSDTKKFAKEYSDTKAMDFGVDNETHIYTCEVNCNLFDINNEGDYLKLKNNLPETIKYTYNDFGFETTETLDEYLLNLKGYYTYEPHESFLNAKVGDKIPTPEYAKEFYIITDKSDNSISYYKEISLENLLSNLFSKRRDMPYKPLYDFMHEFVKNVAKEYPSEENIRAYYQYFKSKKNSYGLTKIDDSYMEQFDILYSNMKDELVSSITKHLKLEKEILPLDNTWRYYENSFTDDKIKELGYDGYIAKEKGVNTYAIFHPNKCVKIISVD